jgi:hypothetical protein
MCRSGSKFGRAFLEQPPMSTEIDSALTGAAFDMANAGYTAMQDPDDKQVRDSIGSDSASLREAAESRSEAARPIIVKEYLDAKGRSAPPNEAVTLDRAARDHARTRAAERSASQEEGSEALAQRIDALRATAQANDSSAAEFYGFEPPGGQAAGGETHHSSAGKDGSPNSEHLDEPSTDSLAPELEMALQHPQVLRAIEEKIGEVEKVRQSYQDGLAAATQIAQMSFLGQFPEFTNMAPDHVPAALEKMSREEPAKFARVQASVAVHEQLLARQAQEHQRQAEVSRQSFQRFAQSEDARLEVMLKNEPKAVQQAVAAEIMVGAMESGIEPAELNRLFHSEPLMRNATFQRMMYDAAKYRLMMKSKDAVAAKPVPPVLRPGVAATSAERERGDLRALSARLSTSGNLKDAVALYRARKSNGAN